MWSALSADVLVVTWLWTRSLGVVCCWSFGDWLAFIFPWDGGVTKLLLQGDLIVESKQICIGKASRTCGWCDQGVVVSFHPWDGQSSIHPWIGFLHSHSIVSKKICYGWQLNKPSSTIYHHLSPVHYWFPKNGVLINRMTRNIPIDIVHVWVPPSTIIYPQDVSSLFCSEFVAEVLQRGATHFFWVCFRVILYFYQDELQKLWESLGDI